MARFLPWSLKRFFPKSKKSLPQKGSHLPTCEQIGQGMIKEDAGLMPANIMAQGLHSNRSYQGCPNPRKQIHANTKDPGIG